MLNPSDFTIWMSWSTWRKRKEKEEKFGWENVQSTCNKNIKIQNNEHMETHKTNKWKFKVPIKVIKWSFNQIISDYLKKEADQPSMKHALLPAINIKDKEHILTCWIS